MNLKGIGNVIITAAEDYTKRLFMHLMLRGVIIRTPLSFRMLV
jgi:hypothetical protein